MNRKTPRPVLSRGESNRTGKRKGLAPASDYQGKAIKPQLQVIERSTSAFRRAEARLVVTRWSIQTLVVCCPFCGAQHLHGGSGLDNGDPRDAFSGLPINSHCLSVEGGCYVLVPSVKPAAFAAGDSCHPRARAGMRRLAQMGIPISNERLVLRRRNRWR